MTLQISKGIAILAASAELAAASGPSLDVSATEKLPASPQQRTELTQAAEREYPRIELAQNVSPLPSLKNPALSPTVTYTTSSNKVVKIEEIPLRTRAQASEIERNELRRLEKNLEQAENAALKAETRKADADGRLTGTVFKNGLRIGTRQRIDSRDIGDAVGKDVSAGKTVTIFEAAKFQAEQRLLQYKLQHRIRD